MKEFYQVCIAYAFFCLCLLGVIAWSIFQDYKYGGSPQVEETESYVDTIVVYNNGYDCDWEIFTQALIWVESRGNSKAIGSKNDVGVLQITPILVEDCNRILKNERFTLEDRLDNKIKLPEGYVFKDENGNVINTNKIVLEKKKKEYPKTYAECCRVLGVSEFEYNHTGTKVWYRHKLMATLDKLMLCRDAYWKLYGEEMGLGKPWEPDWNNVSDKYCIYFVSGHAWSKECQTRQCPFAFPTPEMRDAFKKNFDPDIEICKELL